eukprot:GHVQ01018529.1.p1 GENE.GHVQ01018529.1~~GHVQ01018529.1.p1  ORF type:complete len:803 (-),score=94.01 GHVQ01018529.1:5198-7606(-)
MEPNRKQYFHAVSLVCFLFIFAQLLSLCLGQGIFDLPESNETPVRNDHGVEAGKQLPGITGGSTGRTSNVMREVLFRSHETIADTKLMGLPRKAMQFLACGAPKFGNNIPRSFNEFVERTGKAWEDFRLKSSGLNFATFDWNVPLVESQTSRFVKWSEMARRLGVSVENAILASSSMDVYKSPDNRYVMPKFKLDVVLDTLGSVYDVFLLAPAGEGRAHGHELFQMGAPEEDLVNHIELELHAQQEARAAAAAAIRKDVDDRQHNLDKPDNVASFGGFHDGQPVFFSGDKQTESKVDEAALALVNKLTGEVAQKVSEGLKEKEQKLQAVAETANDVTGVVLNKHTNDVLERLGVNSSPVTDPEKLQAGIEGIVNAVAGNEPTPAETAVNALESLIDILPGKLLPQARVLLTDSIKTNVGEQILQSGIPLRGRALLLEKAPFVFGELTIKSIGGDTVYGPTTMYCPYFSIPETEIRSRNGEALIFEIVMKTQSGEKLADDLGRPVLVKTVVSRGNDKAAKVDNVEDCPSLVLGVRVLDIDFAEFGMKPNSAAKEFVRKTLADSLDLTAEDITFCSTREGSTIAGFFNPDEDLTIQWQDVVTNQQTPIHRILQLDSSYPSYVDKDDLYGLKPNWHDNNLSFPNDSSGVSTEGVPSIGEEGFDLITFPNHNGSGQESVEQPDVDVSLPRNFDLPMPDADKSQSTGTAAWVWALIAIILIVVVVVVAVSLVLFISSRKKLKKDEDVIGGKPLEVMEPDHHHYPKNEDFATGDMQRQTSGIVIGEYSGHGAAINREPKRHIEDQFPA